MSRYPTQFPRTIASTLAAMACLTGAPGVHADDLSSLKAQVDLLQAKISQLENAQAQAASAPPPSQGVTTGATPGSFKLPGSDTSVTLGGYVKLDAIYSSVSAGTNSLGDQAMVPNLIPLTQANEKKQLTLHVRQSRVFAKTSTPSAYGDVVAYIEGDLFASASSGDESNANGHGFRLRHAYGAIGGLLTGQYWTTFMNEATIPETMDFGGPVGQMFVRQAQVRWTQSFANGDWSVSAENPESVLGLSTKLGTAISYRADDDRVPDLVARVRFAAGSGKYSLHAMARNVRVDSAAGAASPGIVDSKTGGALSFAGVISTMDKDDLRFAVNAGNVIGRYQQLSFFSDGYVSPTGRLELANVVSGYAAYRHFWTDTLRSTLVLSAARSSNPEWALGDLNKRSESAHLNLVWSPAKSVNLGAEYIHAKRVVQDGRSGQLNRIQLSGQYGF